MKLDDVYQECLGEPVGFRHKRILFIGSESYDAPVIGVLQGLDKLGFEICTIKPNINSWFCNRVIDDPASLSFDFVLSSLHWGTRWGLYEHLPNYPRVLIDGDDARGKHSWRDKYNIWVDFYGLGETPSRRYMEPLGNYKPDIVFTWQKRFGDGTIYLPGVIHDQFKAMNKGRWERPIDFAHFPGPGIWRQAMEDLLSVGALPGKIHNKAIRGEPIYPEPIKGLIEKDKNNVHSYHRWICWADYFQVLNDSKVVIHPGIDHFPFWECNRIYEAWACNCMVAMKEPCIDVVDYPLTEVCPEAVFKNHEGLIDKANLWYNDSEHLNQLRRESAERSARFFSPEAVARYFLCKVKWNI